jgi:hypothetical protein
MQPWTLTRATAPVQRVQTVAEAFDGSDGAPSDVIDVVVTDDDDEVIHDRAHTERH